MMMMMFRNSRGDRSRRLRTLVLATAAAFLLSACAGSVPKAGEANGPTQQSAVATPTPTPTPIVSTVVMSGSQLVSKTDRGASVGTVDFAEGTDAAVAFLTAALGTAPEKVPASDLEACGNVTAGYAWGAAAALDVLERDGPGFVVTFREPSFDGVALLSSGDFAVGDNAQAFFDGLPPEQALDEYNDGSGPFVYDQVAAGAPWGEGNGFGGVAFLKPGGVVSAIVAPDTTRAFYC